MVWFGANERLARIAEQLTRVLGLSRVTVNRVLARLAQAGAVTLTDRGIVVADGHASTPSPRIDRPPLGQLADRCRRRRLLVGLISTHRQPATTLSRKPTRLARVRSIFSARVIDSWSRPPSPVCLRPRR
ncbi:hypothetical protein E1166_02180 [Micromonospora sp. KC213]|nr:hypothetical protein E1166_02180 [Micromonospora sp. KC213]